MAYDPVLLLALAGAAAFLSVLVWLMYDQARKPEWSDISAQAREGRKKMEKEHGG